MQINYWLMAVGKMQNCGMWTVEGKMQNGNCGMVVWNGG